MDSMLSSEEPHRRRPLLQQTSEEDMEYEDSSYDEDEEEEYDEEEEDVTNDIIDEEGDSELEEEEDEDLSNDEKRDIHYTSESEEESRYSYSLEEETYHPRAVNLTYNEDTMISAYEGRGPLILDSVPQAPGNPPVPKHSQLDEDISNELKIKSILKWPPSDNNATKSKEVSEIDQSVTNLEEQRLKPITPTEKRFEPNFSPIIPKPILKVREPSQEKLSPASQRRGVSVASLEQNTDLQSSKGNLDEGSDYEAGTKKKQVRIEEPGEVVSRGLPDRRESTPGSLVEDHGRHRTGSLGDDVDATKVLISHYSDIVAEFGRVKRAPKTLYLDYEALKAAAEKEEETVSIPEIVVHEPQVESQVAEEKREPVKIEKPMVFVEPFVEEPVMPVRENRTQSPKRRSQSLKKKRSPSPRVKMLEESLIQSEKESTTDSIEYTRTPSPVLPPRLYTPTEKKVHSYFDFLMDFSLFILACWLYLFKDERLSIPVMCLMIYRQAHEAFQRKMEALRNKLPRRIRFWRKE